jgi:hypothetical protein
MAADLYMKCPLCDGTLKFPAPALRRPGEYTYDCACMATKTPGWAKAGLTVGQIEKIVAERDKLQAFKNWIHDYLDAQGVPRDPDPEGNARHGCRIGGRMSWLVSRLTLPLPRVD